MTDSIGNTHIDQNPVYQISMLVVDFLTYFGVHRLRGRDFGKSKHVSALHNFNLPCGFAYTKYAP